MALKTKKQRICLKVRILQRYIWKKEKKECFHVSTIGGTVRLLIQMTIKRGILYGGRNVKSEFAISGSLISIAAMFRKHEWI